MIVRKCAPLLAALLTLVFAGGASALESEASSGSHWIHDLDYLVGRLELTHPNLYANIAKDTFSKHVRQLREDTPGLTDVQIVYRIQELIARVRNLHTLSTPPLFWDTRQALKSQFRYYPIRYYPFQDGLYVASVSKRYRGMLGKKVIRIGNLTVEEAMRALARFVAADNKMTILANVPRWCLNDGQLLHYIGAGDSPNKITIALERDDSSTSDVTISTSPQLPMPFYRPFIHSDNYTIAMNVDSKNPVPLYMTQMNKPYWFVYLPDHDAVYLQINVLNDEESESFEDFCQRMFRALDEKKAKRLILDLRLNCGGDHIELPLLKGILARPHIDRSDRLFLIIGRLTASAAQHLTSELERLTNVTVFGEPTASKPNQYGAMTRFNLPHSGLEIACATKFFQDAQPDDFAVASFPDIYVQLTSGDFKDNRDPVLERIFEFDSYKGMRRAFFQAMSKAYRDGGIASIKDTFNTLRKEYTNAGWNMEILLYDDFDGWIAGNRRDDADYIAFLEWIHQELSDSIKVPYDLAYWMGKTGHKEEARKLYGRCLELNPEHRRARWRRDLMEFEETWRSEP